MRFGHSEYMVLLTEIEKGCSRHKTRSTFKTFREAKPSHWREINKPKILDSDCSLVDIGDFTSAVIQHPLGISRTVRHTSYLLAQTRGKLLNGMSSNYSNRRPMGSSKCCPSPKGKGHVREGHCSGG